MIEKADSGKFFKNLPNKMPERAPQELIDQLKAAFPDKYNSKQHADRLSHLGSALENGEYVEAHITIAEMCSQQAAVSGNLTEEQKEAVNAFTAFYNPNKV